MTNILFGEVLNEPLTFEQAVDYFGDKMPVDRDTFRNLVEEYRGKAFTVSGYSSLTILKRFHEELLKDLENGGTVRDFRMRMNEFLVQRGYDGITPFQADNVFRTNIQTAYNVGHHRRMSDPAVKALRPYWMYDAVEDGKTRPQHRALDGKVYPADHGFWDTWYPPNGYRCRCAVRSLSGRQVESMGLKVEEGSDMPKLVTDHAGRAIPLIPQQGFDTNPTTNTWKPDITKFPTVMQEAYKKRNET